MNNGMYTTIPPKHIYDFSNENPADLELENRVDDYIAEEQYDLNDIVMLQILEAEELSELIKHEPKQITI